MRPKLPFFIFLGSNFTKLMLVELQNFIQNENTLNSGPKMYCLGTFKPKFEKKYCHTWNQHLWICQNAKFHVQQKNKTNKKKRKEKEKKSNLGPKLSYLVLLLDWNLKKVSLYLKSSILKLSKFHVIGPKLPYLSILKLEFEKSIVIFKINKLKFIKNSFLSFVVNFGIGSTFSKGPGSQFFWRSGSGLSLAL